MRNNWREKQLRAGALKRRSEATSEKYKNIHKSETVDISKITAPCRVVNGKSVDATWDKSTKSWVWK